MKDTRKISVIYFMISMILLLMVAFGCSRCELDYIHTYNDCDVFYVETDNPEYIEMYANHLKESVDNFIIQSDFGIIEVENGEVIYNNLK